MRRKDQDFLISFIDGFGKKSQELLRWEAHRRYILDNYNNRQEREKLKNEIKSEILKEIEITVDAEELLQEIEKIKKALDNLLK